RGDAVGPQQAALRLLAHDVGLRVRVTLRGDRLAQLAGERGGPLEHQLDLADVHGGQQERARDPGEEGDRPGTEEEQAATRENPEDLAQVDGRGCGGLVHAGFQVRRGWRV